MSVQRHLAPSDQSDRDLYARERVLNSAIISADISRGWEEYLAIFDTFYADDVEVTTDTETGPIYGRERIRRLLFNFLAPLHVMVEIGGLAIDVRESPIHGDTPNETHSAWSVNLIGVSGRACVLKWSTLRRWADSRVVYERHYDQWQSSGPLTGDDLRLNQSLAPLGYGQSVLTRATFYCKLSERIQDSVPSDEVLIQTAISSWEQVIRRIETLCLCCSDEQRSMEVAPGKNRISYLWGHLTAVNDSMSSILRLGERLHPELDAVFIAQPDRSVPLPTSTEIAKCWEDVHTELLSRFKTLSSKEWLERHGNVSPEEFERDPMRNRLAVLLGRTNHASYHFGQMMLAKPKTP